MLWGLWLRSRRGTCVIRTRSITLENSYQIVPLLAPAAVLARSESSRGRRAVVSYEVHSRTLERCAAWSIVIASDRQHRDSADLNVLEIAKIFLGPGPLTRGISVVRKTVVREIVPKDPPTIEVANGMRRGPRRIEDRKSVV